MLIRLSSFLCSAFIFLAGLSSHQAKAQSELSVNARAHLLSGKNIAPRERQAQWVETSPEWNQARAEGVYALWQSNQHGLSAGRRRAIESFASSHLSEAYNGSRAVFYPFGGPDVIYPSLMFPRMRTLVLVGREPIREVPQIHLSELPRRMRDIRAAFRSLFKNSFFITEDMSRELAEFGTLTTISVGLVLLGNTIIDVEPVSLGGQRVASGKAQGVRITYQGPRSGIREVYYFQHDLSNSKISPAFKSFITRLAPETSLFKAASFLPHKGEFSQVNQLALQSRYVIQSDTGPRMSFYDRNGSWDIRLFGRYSQPAVSLFGNQCYQSDLAQAYELRSYHSAAGNRLQWYPTRGSKSGQLPFRYCYQGPGIIYALRR